MSIDNLFTILWILVLFHIIVTWLLAIRLGRMARKSDNNKSDPTPNHLPPVSVIVPAWNEKGTVEKNIGALRQVAYPRWEALIVAGGEDGTFQAAEQAAAGDTRFLVLARGPEPKNAALNKGIQSAQYDILVLLDTDNIVEPGWLAALITPFTEGASVSVGHSFPNRITWVTLEERMRQIYTYQVLKRSWIQGDRSIAIRRELLKKIGGLPEHTYAREDWDIWARLGQTGEKVAFAEEAHLTTDRPSTVRESWKHQVRWRRTHLNGLWEHRASLLKQPVDLFGQVYGYLQSVLVSLLFFLALMATLFWPDWSRILWNLLGLLIAWFCGRQAAVAFAVAAYTRDGAWLGRAWLPALNLFLYFPASLAALLTFNRLDPYYKGPRHKDQHSKTT